MSTTISRRPASVSPLARRYRPTVEALEDRVVPTLGPEFFVGGSLGRVNEVRTASSANGSSIAVWSVDEIEFGNYDVYAQRFDAFYNPVGDPFLIAATSDDEDQPDVAMDGNGNFVVVWRRHSSEDSGGTGSFDIFFSTHVISLPGGGSGGSGGIVDASVVDVSNPRVTMNDAGIWTVAFEARALNGLDIFARRFDLTGHRRGGDIPVATNPLANEFGPVIDGNAAGRFSIAYLHETSPSKGSLFVKRYSPAGKLLGTSKVATNLSSPTDTGSEPPENPRRYDLAMDNAGNTTVVYAQATSLTGVDIFSRQITRQGVLGGRKIISNLARDQLDPVIGMDRVTGRFVVAFSTFTTDVGLQTIVQERTKKGRLIVQHPPVDTPFEIRPNSVSVDGDGTYLIGLLLRRSGSGLDAYAAFGELP